MCALKASSLITVGWLLTVTGAFPAAQHSALWGERGEKWATQGRLPDFSFTGYHCGEKALPTVPTGVSVKDFGAKGDGMTDDSQAFLDALAKVRSGAIEVPPGRYQITRILETARPSETTPDGKWFEAINPAEIQPQDLHTAQLRRRLGTK